MLTITAHPLTKTDDEEEERSASPPAVVAAVSRGNFDDEEEGAADVLDSWDAAEDSEVEREKAKKAEEARVKAAEKAKAERKSKAERIEAKRQERLAKHDDFDVSDHETEEDRLAAARRAEKDSDMQNAADLFESIGINPNRGAPKPVTLRDSSDPTKSIELSSLPLFTPTTAEQFHTLRDTIVPLLGQNSKKAQYALFLPEFCKALAKDLNSEQIKKIASTLTTLSNERMKEEKTADKSGKKTKAAKTKASLSAARDISSRADTTAYDDGLEDDDFM